MLLTTYQGVIGYETQYFIFFSNFKEMIRTDNTMKVRPITSSSPKQKQCTKRLVTFYAISKYKTWY